MDIDNIIIEEEMYSVMKVKIPLTELKKTEHTGSMGLYYNVEIAKGLCSESLELKNQIEAQLGKVLKSDGSIKITLCRVNSDINMKVCHILYEGDVTRELIVNNILPSIDMPINDYISRYLALEDCNENIQDIELNGKYSIQNTSLTDYERQLGKEFKEMKFDI